ncbi:MAG: Oxygen regulatory protein NreC [Bacteroidia bacterium]|nr:Oxygen regulatory protein NreC [Bacteroidia bacterium]
MRPINEIINGINTANLIAEKSDNLTKRELEILDLVAQGYTSQEISDKIFISYDTAETHRRNIIKKLKAENVANAVAIAIRAGIIK